MDFGKSLKRHISLFLRSLLIHDFFRKVFNEYNAFNDDDNTSILRTTQ